MKYVLVLDVAKSKSMFMLSSDVGEVLLEPTEYIHNKSDFERIDSYISKLNIKDNLTVIMEATSIYHKAPERFFKEFPHAYIIKDKRVDALAYNMANTNDRHLNYYKRKANIIKEYAINSYPGVSENSKDVDNLKQLANIIIEIAKQKEIIKEQMIELAKQTKNFECINSLFGIGELSASLIIAELKDITRFNNIKQINASCGLDPTIVQSGKSINYHGPISKRGNRYARKILFNCSRNIVTLSAKCDKENPIYVYYQKKKQEGKHYYACLTACSTKLIRIIYALYMNNSTQQN